MLFQKLNKTNFINLLFFLIPISFIAGNLILNLNIILFIITGAIFYKFEIFKIKLVFIDKIIIVFFLYTLIIGITNNLYNYYYESSAVEFKVITKTLTYLRFLFFYFLIRFLVLKKIINFKFFFTSAGLSALFVCIDLIIQLTFGKDIFGYDSAYIRMLSGPFGDEWIAGSYLQRFSPFLFFLVPLFYNFKNKNIFKIFSATLIILVLFGALIAGNRMPFFLLLMILSLILILENKSRKYLLHFIIISSLVLIFVFKFKPSSYVHFNNFLTKSTKIFSAVISSEKDFSDPVFNTHFKEFYSGYETWKESKFFGGGIKSFPQRCVKIVINCANHPHNYYLEILSELGLVGFLILSIIFGLVIYDTFIRKYLIKDNLQNNNIIIPFMFLFLAEIFPFKTSGSFFTTANATYIFLVMAITIALSQSNDKKI